MFKRLFGQKTAKAPKPTTGGRLVYAIGDVHGRLDALGPLVRDVLQDAAGHAGETPMLIFLGDYVDRGADSKGVIDLILELQAASRLEVVPLKGNHEEALLKFLDDPEFGSTWLEHGGGQTLASYGVNPPTTRTDPAAWQATREAFDAVLPDAHRRFYQTLKLMTVVGDYAFVHAGVRPGVALDDQSERDLLWIRHEFLNDRGPFEKIVVHGHTPLENAQMLPHRLGLDTGCYATGLLTAARLEGEDQRLLQVTISRRVTA